MSWIDRELKRRKTQARPTATVPLSARSDAERMLDLWGRFEQANQLLPDEIQLQAETAPAIAVSHEDVQFLAWLRAPNGAAVGFAGNAIRYVWPKEGRRTSNNFWIRWDVDQQVFVVNQRISATSPPAYGQRRFDERGVARMVKCLVLGKQVKAKSVMKRRFWLF